MKAGVFSLRCFSALEAAFPAMVVEFIVYGRDEEEIGRAGKRYLKSSIAGCDPPCARAHVVGPITICGYFVDRERVEPVVWPDLAEQVEREHAAEDREGTCVFLSNALEERFGVMPAGLDAEQTKAFMKEHFENQYELVMGVDPVAGPARKHFLASRFRSDVHERAGEAVIIKSDVLGRATARYCEMIGSVPECHVSECPRIFSTG